MRHSIYETSNNESPKKYSSLRIRKSPIQSPSGIDDDRNTFINQIKYSPKRKDTAAFG